MASGEVFSSVRGLNLDRLGQFKTTHAFLSHSLLTWLKANQFPSTLYKHDEQII